MYPNYLKIKLKVN